MYVLSEAEKKSIDSSVKEFWAKKLKTEITPDVEKKILAYLSQGKSLRDIKIKLEVEKSLAGF